MQKHSSIFARALAAATRRASRLAHNRSRTAGLNKYVPHQGEKEMARRRKQK